MPEPQQKVFNKATDITPEQLKDFDFATQRILNLRGFRTDVENGVVEKTWADADRDYVPHRLRKRGKRAIVTDEDKGWRGVLVNLGSHSQIHLSKYRSLSPFS